ncbi:nuclear transport factor 2 family protein [Tateyamaria pelophila]|uniref:hypothetical protein n=1 Tax=Tateyamaria pelophila TaxID=328415 RepID=UPI001CBC9117|nr:hypothetical protein [Tateyamaria pelophila]
MRNARQIYQETLDGMTAAVMSRDPAAFAEYVEFPYEIRVMDGMIVCKDKSDVARSVNNFAEQLEQYGVTDMSRVCDSAQFLNADHIIGHHTSRVMSGDKEVISPYVTRLGLYRSKDGHWRATLSDSVLCSADWQLIPNWVSQTEGDSLTKDVSAQDKRLKLFQTILDRISAAFLSGDADAWLNACSLPFQLVSRHGVETFTTRDEMRRDFEAYQREFKTHGVTDIIREAKTAELIDDDHMVGTYRTHIMNRGNHVVPPWEASLTLRREDGIWRATTVMRAIGHLNWSAQTRAAIEDIPQDTPKKGDHQ